MHNNDNPGSTANGESDLGAFMRALVHEVANPLNAISMNAELVKLLLERGHDAHARETLDHLLSDCARSGRLLHGYRRFGAGLLAHTPEVTGVCALVSAAIDLASQERRGMPVVRVDGSDALIEVDRLALQQAIAALLHNAADAGASAVQVAVSNDARGIGIDVIDDGSGIAPRLRERVFEPFFSTHRAEGASGLGLTLGSILLHRHGGQIHIADDDAEHCTRVCMLLPAALIRRSSDAAHDDDRAVATC